MFKKIEQNNLIELSDERLAVLASQNNQEALEVLVSRYLKTIYNFIYSAVASHEEAEDLTQEVFVKVWKNLSKFDSNRTFRPWLYKIAKNTYLDYYRQKRPSPWAALAESALAKFQPRDQLWSIAGDSPEEITDKHLLQDKVKLATAGLTASASDILALRHEAGLSFREIAQMKNQPLNTVKSVYGRSLSKIRKFFS